MFVDMLSFCSLSVLFCLFLHPHHSFSMCFYFCYMVLAFHWQYGDMLLAIFFFTYYFVLSLKNKYTVLYYNSLLCSTTTTHYDTQFVQCPHNSKAMFRTVNMLMRNKGGCPLPSQKLDIPLASDFSNVVTSKVSTIRRHVKLRVSTG